MQLDATLNSVSAGSASTNQVDSQNSSTTSPSFDPSEKSPGIAKRQSAASSTADSSQGSGTPSKKARGQSDADIALSLNRMLSQMQASLLQNMDQRAAETNERIEKSNQATALQIDEVNTKVGTLSQHCERLDGGLQAVTERIHKLELKEKAKTSGHPYSGTNSNLGFGT